MEIVIGVLAAWGGIMLVWTLMGLVFLPLTRRSDIRITAVIHGPSVGGLLSWYFRGLVWLRNLGLLWWDIAVIEDQMTPEVRQLALSMTEKEPHARVLPTETLIEWMEQ